MSAAFPCACRPFAERELTAVSLARCSNPAAIKRCCASTRLRAHSVSQPPCSCPATRPQAGPAPSGERARRGAGVLRRLWRGRRGRRRRGQRLLARAGQPPAGALRARRRLPAARRPGELWRVGARREAGRAISHGRLPSSEGWEVVETYLHELQLVALGPRSHLAGWRRMPLTCGASLAGLPSNLYLNAHGRPSAIARCMCT